MHSCIQTVSIKYVCVFDFAQPRVQGHGLVSDSINERDFGFKNVNCQKVRTT